MRDYGAIYFDNKRPFTDEFYSLLDDKHAGIRLSRTIPKALERLVRFDTMKLVYIRLVGSSDARNTEGGKLIEAIRENAVPKYRDTKIITISSSEIDLSTIPYSTHEKCAAKWLHFYTPVDYDIFYDTTYDKRFESID